MLLEGAPQAASIVEAAASEVDEDVPMPDAASDSKTASAEQESKDDQVRMGCLVMDSAPCVVRGLI